MLAQRWRTRLPPMWSRFDSALSALGALTVLVLCYVVTTSGLWFPLLAGALVLGFEALRQTYDDY